MWPTRLRWMAADLIDIHTAVTEACNNVVQHAYGGEEGLLDVAWSWRRRGHGGGTRLGRRHPGATRRHSAPVPAPGSACQ